MRATTHASTRCQQRGVSPFVVDLLLRFGRREHDHKGAEIVFFDRRAKKEVESYTGGSIGKLSEQMDSYAVVSDGCVITVGVRHKKINRH
jgi:hypothetical protein